jgi:hypothetical protein
MATKIRSSFEDSIARFHASPALQALAGGQITLEHYKAILREIYHYSKEDPQIQALATVYFRGDDRDSVKMFLKHAISEIGHDQLALADLEALGERCRRGAAHQSAADDPGVDRLSVLSGPVREPGGVPRVPVLPRAHADRGRAKLRRRAARGRRARQRARLSCTSTPPWTSRTTS